MPANWKAVVDRMDALTRLMARRFDIERQVTSSEQMIERGNKTLRDLDKQVMQLHMGLSKMMHRVSEAEVNLR